jgi:NADP-dependent 3-hydroxy acid dehydrogenase YdfG
MLQPESVFLITGAASGVGAATTRLAVSRGHRVAACDVNRDGLAALCTPLGANAQAIDLDVRDPEDWGRALDAVWQRFGRLDVLVNNAGLVHVGFMHEVPLEKLRHMVDVNVLGVIYGVRLSVPRFLKQGHGHIVNVASLASFVPLPGQATYAGTKHAVRAFNHGVALELRDTPITLTLICPAAIDTPMLRQQISSDAAALSFADKSLTAEQVAEAVLRGARDKPREILLPAARGELLRVAGVFPGVVARMVRGAEARGRRVLMRLRQGSSR